VNLTSRDIFSIRGIKKMEVAKQAVELFGAKEQTLIAIEEMGELIVALNHYRRNRCESHTVIFEIADVLLSLESLKEIYGRFLVEEAFKMKSERLRRRIEKLKDSS
jgi:NTP pyrophosphatase (non-canonical NTP hydrolase)